MLNPSIAIHSVAEEVREIIKKAEQDIRDLVHYDVKLKPRCNGVDYDKVEEVKRCIEKVFGHDWQKIISRNRREEFRIPRYAFNHILCNLFFIHEYKVGEETYLERTSIIHSLDVINNYFETGDARAQAIRDVEEMYLGRVKTGG